MVFCMAYTPDGRLLNTRGGALHMLDDRTGETIRTYALEGKGGWAVVTASADNQHAYLGNFFVGKLIKLDLESGGVIASAEIGVERALAGIAEYNG